MGRIWPQAIGVALTFGARPLVKAVRRDQAAALAHGVAEGRLAEKFLGAGVEQGRESLRILDEVRQ